MSEYAEDAVCWTMAIYHILYVEDKKDDSGIQYVSARPQNNDVNVQVTNTSSDFVMEQLCVGSEEAMDGLTNSHTWNRFLSPPPES